MKNTKQKILNAALLLFNRDGIVNVRLQHIADEAFVSVGNLAYHFPNKEAITTTLYESLTKRQKELLAHYRIVPLFDNINLLLQQTYQLQQQYVFFYLDTLEIMRAYPQIAQTHQEHISFQIRQLQSMLEFNAARGVIKPEAEKGSFEKLAIQIWMTTDLWLTQYSIRKGSNSKEQAFIEATWALLIPHFTKLGQLEHQQMLQMPSDLHF